MITRNQLGILLLVIATPVASHAQAKAANPPADVSDCSQLFEKAEASFRVKIGRGEERFRAERDLSAVVQLCKYTPFASQAEEQLKVVREELAGRDLAIALFYIERYRSTGRTRGALSRLRSIVERYPKYSKLDQVLSLRGQLSLVEEELEEAAACYERILKDFPASQYIGEALIQLRAIENMRTAGQLEP
jgi:outer membrane protein assembly factor BamD (BamD/ComL family)